jgi:hypothetical protein
MRLDKIVVRASCNTRGIPRLCRVRQLFLFHQVAIDQYTYGTNLHVSTLTTTAFVSRRSSASLFPFVRNHPQMSCRGISLIR